MPCDRAQSPSIGPPTINEGKRCSTVQLGRQLTERSACLQSENRNGLDTTWDVGAERYLSYAGASASFDNPIHTRSGKQKDDQSVMQITHFRAIRHEFAYAARHRPWIPASMRELWLDVGTGQNKWKRVFWL